jgi:hypothetical protein
VGFPVNIASFVFVPQAFRHAADGDPGQFRRVLLNGAGVALGLALAALAAVMLFRAVLPHRALIAGPFDPLIFVILSVAVILNRVKKLVLDPLSCVPGSPSSSLSAIASERWPPPSSPPPCSAWPVLRRSVGSISSGMPWL